MKKKFLAVLLAGMVLTSGQAISAKEALPTGYQEIDNSDGTQYDPKKGVEIPVKGTLGKIDSTDPNENLPEGDYKWLRVTLPTSVAFHSDQKNNKVIASYDYTIKNLSGRPVNVRLNSFTGEANVPAIKLLQLKSTNGAAIDLVKDGKLVAKEQQLVKNLAAQTGSHKFTYTGTVDPAQIHASTKKAGEVVTQRVSYKMNLKFEVLNPDGTSVVANH